MWSESETTVHSQPVGQMFGLFGLTADETNDELKTEEGELIETNNDLNHQLVDKCHQNIGPNEVIDENQCIICKKSETKYRCPKCETKSCSLSCSKTHKMRFNCDGMREKSAFVKISDFSEQIFLSDYFFLEDIDRTIDSTSRERRTIINSKPVLPKWLQKLIREARLRGINLKIMPAGFKRRKQNTTCFMYAQNTINWDIEFKFIHALDSKDMKISDELLTEDLVVSHSEYSSVKYRICENTTLLELISQYIESNDLIENYEQNRKLLLYRNSGINGISVLFGAQNSGSKQQKYFELDVNKTIKENLVHKTVIEFPTLLVILNRFKHLFEIITDEKPKSVSIRTGKIETKINE